MPHTKQQLKLLLESVRSLPHHKWGQNFLIDLNLMRFLVEAVALQGGEVVLEVGCGSGSLTDLLASKARFVVAVEIDEKLTSIAQKELAQHKNISIINGDVLANKNTINPLVLDSVYQARRRGEGPFYLVSNLPYQVASPLIVNLLLDPSVIPDGIFVTVQAEVADRMVAKPGSKSYGILSVLMQATGFVKRLRTIKPQAFWPMPKVASAMIMWQRDKEKCQAIQDMATLKIIIGLLFGHRRKKIKTCLAEHSAKIDFLSLLQKVDIDPDVRGETLTPPQFIKLANSWLPVFSNTSSD